MKKREWREREQNTNMAKPENILKKIRQDVVEKDAAGMLLLLCCLITTGQEWQGSKGRYRRTSL